MFQLQTSYANILEKNKGIIRPQEKVYLFQNYVTGIIWISKETITDILWVHKSVINENEKCGIYAAKK